MKTAFITTVFNEEKSILDFLDSLLMQTKKPDEVVIVDAFSKDNTFKILKLYKKKFDEKFPKVSFRIFQKRGNRSMGRNFAIKKANSDVIVVSDAGCILRKDWFYRIISPFEKNDIDVVSGFYMPITNSVFQKCLATYTCVQKDHLDNNFLPSSRSVAFKKSAWEKVGGYPENLDTCEDLVFARNLKRNGFKFKVQKNAIVYWQQKTNIWQALFQFFNYAKGDGQALYIRKNTPFLFLRYLIGIILVIVFLKTKSELLLLIVLCLLFLYIFWAIMKNYKYIENLKAIFWLPILQFTSDISVMSGFITGFTNRIL